MCPASVSYYYLHILCNIINKDYLGSNFVPVQGFRSKCKDTSGLTGLLDIGMFVKFFFRKTRPGSQVNGKSVSLRP